MTRLSKSCDWSCHFKESDRCARRKHFNKSTECTLGFYKCAIDQNPKLIESSYPDAISNCAEFVEFSQISQVILNGQSNAQDI